MTEPSLAFPVLLLAIGAGFLVLGLGAWNTHRRKRSRGALAEGVIVGHSWEGQHGGPHRNRSIYAYPEVEFVDHRGQTRRFVHQAGSDLRPKEGSRVRVRYDPDSADFGPMIEGDPIQAGLPVLLAGAGALVLAFGAWRLWAALA